MERGSGRRRAGGRAVVRAGVREGGRGIVCARKRLACAESKRRILAPQPRSCLLLPVGPHRLSKELERARSRAGGDAGGVPAVSYGNIPGFAEEMRHLGDCYMQGIEGHSKDAGRAYKYYEAAAVHGCVRMLVACA